ncbi:Transcriptional regulator, TetR family [uncultured Mycobacterium sp.]|uniref:Transcriptional regulator, TetR family n=1 Tax=uncultured Mycobacterium sp. TaxID=171292 RepID=A0A1Y5PBL3_9MYCO|nr:Transcriptional regulator, TetR family [uncultured Mycobacterium sp.]
MRIALDLFWRHGYEGVSIADLCQAIGIAPPSLYHAFGSKTDLYREAVRLYQASNLTPDDIAAASSARLAVQNVLERGVERVTQPDSPVGCMISSGMLMVGVENAGLAVELRSLRAELREALELRISRDVEAGVLPDTTDPTALARFYATVLQGLSVQAVDGATRADLDAVILAALRAWPV